ncbi:MAG: AP2 domain-containing protein [Sphingomonas sp.]
MKEIPLTKGKVALVDDDDFDELSKFKWFFSKGYALKSEDRYSTEIIMHRRIMNAPDGMDTDHINHNGLDNRRENLRVCTRSENLMNRGKLKNNTSGYKGVSWNKNSKKWQTHIRVNGKKIYLGNFKDKEEAYKAYCDASIKYHGDFSKV